MGALKAGNREYFVWDRDLKGFGLRVQPTGEKSYVVKYRAGSGRNAPTRRVTLGPVGKLTLRRPGAMSVGPMLMQWFLLNLVVAFVAAFAAIGAGDGHHAAHIAGLATLLAYGAGAVSEAIWMGKPWAATFKDLLDALIYAVVTAAVFMWFWP